MPAVSPPRGAVSSRCRRKSWSRKDEVISSPGRMWTSAGPPRMGAMARVGTWHQPAGVSPAFATLVERAGARARLGRPHPSPSARSRPWRVYDAGNGSCGWGQEAAGVALPRPARPDLRGRPPGPAGESGPKRSGSGRSRSRHRGRRGGTRGGADALGTPGCTSGKPASPGPRAARLGLEQLPDKTRMADAREGREGFDFAGHHLRAHISSRWLERGSRGRRSRRWPSARRIRRRRQAGNARAHRTGNWVNDVRMLISDLNPFLRDGGNHLRTRNVAERRGQVDLHAGHGQIRVLVRGHGRTLTARRAMRGRSAWFQHQGLVPWRRPVRPRRAVRPC